MVLTKPMVATALALALALGACDKKADGAEAGSSVAKNAAGGQTIADGTGDATKFAAAAKEAGLDATLAGPGPYTVLIPSDAAFDRLPAGTLDGLMKKDARTELTGVLTYHILPGTILTDDIAKAVDAGKGKAQLPTMGGGTITATRDGEAIVLSDSAGTKARFTGSEEKKSNGVIHRIDSVLMPS